MKKALIIVLVITLNFLVVWTISFWWLYKINLYEKTVAQFMGFAFGLFSSFAVSLIYS